MKYKQTLTIIYQYFYYSPSLLSGILLSGMITVKGVTVDLRMDFADFERELQRPISDT